MTRVIEQEDRLIVVNGATQYVFRNDGLKFKLARGRVGRIRDLSRLPAAVRDVLRERGIA